ncbi:hypothetical protein BGZ65_004701, partial [Modicella reniformis]
MATELNQADQSAATSSGADADKDNKHSIPEIAASSTPNVESSICSPSTMTAKFKMVSEELLDLKKLLQQVVRRMERLGTSINEVGVVSSEEATIDVTGTILEQQSPSQARVPKAGRRTSALRTKPQRYVGRSPYPRKPNWTLKVLDPHGLSPVDSFEEIEMAESTAKCLKADNIIEFGYIEKHVLPKLIAGDDAILQLRIKLENYAAYPLIDLLDKADSDLQLLVVMNRLDAHSSKTFLSSFEKRMNVANVKADIHIVPLDKKLDLSPLSKNFSNNPKIFVTTPEMMERMKNEGVIKPKSVLAMVVYEAEYVLRTPSHVDIIRSALHNLDNCQVILACHDGTEAVL